MQVTTTTTRLFDNAVHLGKVRGIAKEVYGIICATPGLTGGEIYRRYEAKHPGTSRARNEIAKRITDLANWGGVKGDGLTICPESGRPAQRWVPTGNLPEPKTGPQLRKKKFNQVMENEAFKLLATSELSKLKSEINAVQKALTVAVDREQDYKTQLNLAYKNRDQYLNEAKTSALQVAALKTELASFGNQAVRIEGPEEIFVRKVASEQGWEPKRAVIQAIRTYEMFRLGELVERRKFAEEMKSPVGVQSLDVLQSLNSRNNLILRFRRFLPKRMVRQAERTQQALNFAISYMSKNP